MIFTVKIQRVTDENGLNIKQLKAAGIYQPLPDAEEVLEIEAPDADTARKWAPIKTTLRFSGQEMRTYVNGELALGNW